MINWLCNIKPLQNYDTASTFYRWSEKLDLFHDISNCEISANNIRHFLFRKDLKTVLQYYFSFGFNYPMSTSKRVIHLITFEKDLESFVKYLKLILAFMRLTLVFI